MTVPSNPINNAIPAGANMAARLVAPAPSTGQGLALAASTPEGADYVTTEGLRKTFRFGFNQALAATPTDIAEIIGSANSTIRIHKLRVSGLAATALQDIEVLAIRRSAVHVGGTVAAVTPVSMDILNDGTVTGAVINAFSANGTTAAAIGVVADVVVPFDLKTGANTTAVNLIDIDAATKPITLHGTTDTLCVNLGGVVLANATTVYIDGIYSEDVS